MDPIYEGARRFRCDDFPSQSELYGRLATEGQKPQAMIISCSDSRVVPELITQSGPGDVFVCRNAGNIVPAFGADDPSGVTATVEYAVAALGVRHIVVCGHADCGAMKGLLDPGALKELPAVAAWLRHGRAACEVVRHAHSDLEGAERLSALVRENVRAQLANLRTHPAVARGLAEGRLTLHGWVFEMKDGVLEVLDGATGEFAPLADADAPAAVPPGARRAASAELMAAE